jgi:polyhydroxybutyrate depolymerase
MTVIKRLSVTILFSTLLLFTILLAGCFRKTSDASSELLRVYEKMEFDGRERDYVLLSPVVTDERDDYPLVMALHGGGGDGERMCSLKGGVQEFAVKGGFFVLCPSGIGRHWNDGREIDRWQAHAEKVDDVGFLNELVRRIIDERPVDPARVFVTGISNGGKMSLRLLCEPRGVFSAAAVVIASMPADLNCDPSGPEPVLIINGTEDPLVPWDGGQVAAFGQPLGNVLSTPATVSFWVENNQCSSEPNKSSIRDVNTSDGSWIEKNSYENCAGDNFVFLYTVHGGGHTWPGGVQYLPEFLIGRTNRDAHAGELIWEFFKLVPEK